MVPRQEGHMADTNDVTTDRKIRKQPDKPGTNPKILILTFKYFEPL